MASPLLGSLMQFAGNFAPRGYAFCNGQQIAIAQNTALFALLGTTYGGNGQTTYALPDLRGRGSVHMGTGPGLAPYSQGQIAGTETITINSAQMPAHTHPTTFTPTTQAIKATTKKATSATPTAGALLGRAGDGSANPAATPKIYSPAGSTPTVPLGGVNVAGTVPFGIAGASQPYSNMPPFLCVSVCIATQGIFPARN